MAIKIIKKGTIPTELKARFDCDYCDSQLEAARADGKETDDQRDGHYFTFSCPVCNDRIHVDVGEFKCLKSP